MKDLFNSAPIEINAVDVALIAATHTSAPKTMPVMRVVAAKPTDEHWRVCGEGENEELNPTTSPEACLLSCGSKNWGSKMNDCFEDELQSLDEIRIAELALMSTRDVEDILGARVSLLDTSCRNKRDLVGWLLLKNCVNVWTEEQEY